MVKIILCNRPGGCCPTVELIDKDTVEIIDDYGDNVQMNRDQFAKLQQIILIDNDKPVEIT